MKFSIIIPVYNVAQYLRDTLDSVLAQNDTNWEAICVNDGSSDDSVEILTEYAKKDDRIRVINQENAGVSVARNTGIENAKGDWVLFLDGDDVYCSNALSVLSEAISKNPHADGIRFSYHEFINKVCPSSFCCAEPNIIAKDITKTVDCSTSDAFMWQWAYRRSTLGDIRFNPIYHGMEDNVFSRDFLYNQAKKVVLTNAVIHGYRQQPNSQVHRYPTMRTMHGEFDCRIEILRMAKNCGKSIVGLEASWFMQNFFAKTFVTAAMLGRTDAERDELMSKWFAHVSDFASMTGLPSGLRFRYRICSAWHSKALAYLLFSILPGWGETWDGILHHNAIFTLPRKAIRFLRRRGEFAPGYTPPVLTLTGEEMPLRFFDGIHALREMAKEQGQGAVNRSICFLTGGIDSCPIGGYKVIYEYANRLVARGWGVSIVYPYCGKGSTFPKYLFQHPRKALGFLSSYAKHGKGSNVGGAWFPLDTRVKKNYVLQNSPRVTKRFTKGTKFVATFITTVDDLKRFDVPAKDKINLVQGYEAWYDITPEYVDATYRYPMRKIAISQWLCDKVREAGSEATYIPNGLDFDYFTLSNPIDSRTSTEIAMLWHCDERKRTEDAIAALKLVYKKHPDLHVTAFGTPDKPVDLPPWITYHQRPDRVTHNAIYNNAAIFVASSEQEGWGLTPCEAMQCGAAVACTDIGGYRSFATNGETALMSPARDIDSLATNICKLIENDKLRIQLATKGHENIKKFTWDKSVLSFLKLLEG